MAEVPARLARIATDLSKLREAAATRGRRAPELVVPDVVEFVTSDAYLNRPNIYPRQLVTQLKLAFLQDEIMTPLDHDVVEGWIRSFEATGDNGVQPDVYERMAMCKKEGRHWFREWLAVIGRRGAKNYLGALALAYVLWHYVVKGDPQQFYWIDSGKRLSAQVFAGKLGQARAQQFRDAVAVLTGAPCYEPFIARAGADALTVYSPRDLERLVELDRRGAAGGSEIASFEIVARESTPIAARGPCSFAVILDEMAHVVRAVAAASAAEIYDSAVPSCDLRRRRLDLHALLPVDEGGTLLRTLGGVVGTHPRRQRPTQPARPPGNAHAAADQLGPLC